MLFLLLRVRLYLQLDLLRLSTGTQSRVITACTMLKRMLFRYQVRWVGSVTEVGQQGFRFSLCFFLCLECCSRWVYSAEKAEFT